MPLPVVSINPTPRGLVFGRYVQAKVFAHDMSSAILTAEKAWPDRPEIAECLKSEISYFHKAAVNPGTIAEPTWAAPLAQYGINREVIQLERGASVQGQLFDKFRRVPFRSQIPREIGAGTGAAWVGEGAPTPVVQNAFDTVTQQLYKLEVIVALSRELERLGDPGAQTITTTTVARLVTFLDQQFLDPAVTLIAGTRPASITNGATSITSTGGTAAQIIADLTALEQAITTSFRSPVWVMQPKTAYTIASRLANVGTPTDIPRSLFGIPLVLSDNSPKQITLIDASEILFSDDGGIEVDVSEQATIEMDGTPTSPPTASTVTVALWQNNLIAVKVLRWIAYQRARAGSVAYMVSTY